MRKQIGLKLPESLIKAIDLVCERHDVSRTMYIELAIRERLNKHNIVVREKSEFVRFDGDVEDMLL